MRFLYIGYPLASAGAPHQAMAAFHFSRKGHDLAFYAWGNAPASPDILKYAPNISYHLSPKKGILSAIGFLCALKKAVRTFKPDILYVQGAQHTPFAVFLSTAFSRSKIVYHTQDYLEPGRHKFYEFFESRFARKAGTVISNESNRARFMQSHYRLNSVPRIITTLLPSWWKVPSRDEDFRSHFLEEHGFKSDYKEYRIIVAGGNYGPARCSAQLLDAFKELPESCVLVFTGMKGNSPKIKKGLQHIEELGLQDRVILLDRLPYEELLQLYAISDVGMLIYANDGVGNYYQCPGRLSEYLRCGLPVLASNFPGLELTVLKNNLGNVVDPYSSKEIAEALRSILSLSYKETLSRHEEMKELAEGNFIYEANEEIIDRFIDEIQ